MISASNKMFRFKTISHYKTWTVDRFFCVIQLICYILWKNRSGIFSPNDRNIPEIRTRGAWDVMLKHFFNFVLGQRMKKLRPLCNYASWRGVAKLCIRSYRVPETPSTRRDLISKRCSKWTVLENRLQFISCEDLWDYSEFLGEAIIIYCRLLLLISVAYLDSKFKIVLLAIFAGFDPKIRLGSLLLKICL